MKYKGLIQVITIIVFFVFISSCGVHNSPNPITSPAGIATPTPVIPCVSGDVNFASLASMGLPIASGNYIIKTEADYLAIYSGYAAAGSPTPTPVPIDFSKKMLIGIEVHGGCQEPGWTLTNITTDCTSVNLDVQTSVANCNPSGPVCNSIWTTTFYYIIDKSNLPIVFQYTTINCDGTSNTSSASFTQG